MAVRIADQEFLERLSEPSKAALVSIYDHRCLTEGLLCRFFFDKDHETKGHGHELTQELLNLGCVEAVEYGKGEQALFLTNLGISVVRQTMVYPGKRDLTAANLKMNKFLLPHQMSLNTVALEIEETAKARNIPYEYYDGKYMVGGTSQIELMPDAMFRFNGYDVLLEMDMNSEISEELVKKWGNYRSWMGTEDYLYREHKVIVLFLLCNIKKPEIRRGTVFKTINKGILDKLSPRFDIYVDTPEALEPLLFDWVLSPSKAQSKITGVLRSLQGLGYSTALATTFNQYAANDAEFGFYTRMLSPKTHKIMIKDGRTQEFLLDVITSQTPATAIGKAVFFDNSMLPVRARLGREIPYLIVGEDQGALIADMKAGGVPGARNVYFTTAERLNKSAVLPEAVFQIDQLGRVFHFADFGLTTPVFENPAKGGK